MVGPISFRCAKLDDADLIAQNNVVMAKESESLALEYEVTRRAVEAVLKDPSKGTYFLVEAAGKVAGQLMITYEWSDWRNAQMWWIQSVFVCPEHRKQGLFRRLYEHVREEARSSGAGGVRLYVDKSNTRAETVYANLGMTSHYNVYEEDFQPLRSS